MSSFFVSLTDRMEIDMESLIGQRQEEEEEESQASLDETICSFCPSLSWQERLGGCLGCMVLGYILSFGSFFRFTDLMLGDPTPFVVYSTVGNFISLSGSFFLYSPSSQLKKMFHEKRKIATLLYLGSLFTTLSVAFIPFSDKFRGVKAMILVLLLICQFFAIAWYCLSYIPFARQMATRAFNSLTSRVETWG